MTKQIAIGEFQPFINDIEVAEVSGAPVKRATDTLGTRPPFRDAAESEALAFDDYMDARRLAIDSSGVLSIAIEAGEIDPTIDMVIFSRTGALALRSAHLSDTRVEAMKLISALDGFNDIASVHAHPLHIG